MPRSGKRALLDTNVLLRFLRLDDAEQSPRALALMKRLESGSEEAVLEDAVLAETVWMLEKGFRIPRPEIALHMGRLIACRGLQCRAKRVVLDAMTRFAATRCDIVDCLLAARANSRKAKVYTFDADFRKLGCAWEEPS